MRTFDPEPEHRVESSRAFAVAPEALFAAWADPERLARWWGPAGFRNEFERFEPRPGGEWRFVMVGPAGDRHANVWRFLEVEPGRRVLACHDCEPYFTMEMRYSAEGAGSRLTWLARFDSADFLRKMRGFLAEKNEENFDRLEAELGRVTGGAS